MANLAGNRVVGLILLVVVSPELVVLLNSGGVSGGCGSGLVSPEMRYCWLFPIGDGVGGVLDWGFAGDEGGFGTGGYESI
ncbi:hypothetical protein KY290_028809 [Solanum tuberosum]|uniref:Secreted protein n=1 Tax=Solanum tuberosum TaxID=4113 RepID=A0ABQ7UJ01_SOLTU|nr:hypothetical protein KY284_027798 [Solanum tuberosum]KAH0749577.1 hypothetical protein KY290_028809 [Solanum tuberosum]